MQRPSAPEGWPRYARSSHTLPRQPVKGGRRERVAKEELAGAAKKRLEQKEGARGEAGERGEEAERGRKGPRWKKKGDGG